MGEKICKFETFAKLVLRKANQTASSCDTFGAMKMGGSPLKEWWNLLTKGTPYFSKHVGLQSCLAVVFPSDCSNQQPGPVSISTEIWQKCFASTLAARPMGQCCYPYWLILLSALLIISTNWILNSPDLILVHWLKAIGLSALGQEVEVAHTRKKKGMLSLQMCKTKSLQRRCQFSNKFLKVQLHRIQLV